MVALLLIAAAQAGSLADRVEDRFLDAQMAATEAAGTPEFDEAYAVAKQACTFGLRWRISCDLALVDLIRLDREQEAYEEELAYAQAETGRRSEPIELDEEESVVPVPAQAPVRVVFIDQPTGLEYVGGLSAQPSPWRGLALKNWDGLGYGKGPFMVCVMKDGKPIPVGNEVAFSFSHERGTPPFACPAALVYDEQYLYVPDGSTVHVARFDPYRQVWVVDATRRCEVQPHSGERVQRKDVTACGGG